MTELDPALRAALDRRVPMLPAGAWSDVLARAGVRPRRRRLALALALAGALALVAAPALALRGRLTAIFSARPQPPRVEREYSSLPLAGRIGGMLHSRIDSARLAWTWGRADGSALRLRVASVESGGFCWRAGLGRTSLGGGCETARKRATFRRAAVLTGPSPSGGLQVAGYVTYADAASFAVVYRSGVSTRIPLVWISKPIDAGFFFFEAPPGRKLLRLVIRDRDGRVVSRSTLPGPTPSGGGAKPPSGRRP